MPRPRFCLCLILFIGSSLWLSVAFGEVLIGTVIAVHDGDTITVRSESKQIKIRLAGIDAPELNQPFGQDSRKVLREAVLERQVQLDVSKKDKYGRVVGRVKLNELDINLQQIQFGLAWVYPEYLRELAKEDRRLYLEVETSSKKNERGLWSAIDPVAPWLWRKSKRVY